MSEGYRGSSWRPGDGNERVEQPITLGADETVIARKILSSASTSVQTRREKGEKISGVFEHWYARLVGTAVALIGVNRFIRKVCRW